MKEHPILFSDAMVRAILAGKKTQTRRVINPKPIMHFPLCRYGQPGDVLWVRETWAESDTRGRRQIAFRADGQWGAPTADGGFIPHGWVVFVADNDRSGQWLSIRAFGPWKPSIHMPRSCCRIVLEITDIRAERLQAISPEDCIAEGIDRDSLDQSNIGQYWREDARAKYCELWDSIHRKQHTWAENPWVWVVEFKRRDEP